jgi:AMIN domain
MKRLIYLGSLVVLAAMLSAQTTNTGPGEVRKVEVFPASGEIRVEITLSAAVTPSVETAQHPYRLVLKLPATVSEAQQKRINVQQLGVRSVRFGLNRPDPPETRLVVDLDQEHPYKILTEGTRIILVVEPPLSVSASQRNAPAAAATRPLISSLGRRSDSGDTQSGSQSNQGAVLLAPPPAGPPINFPAASGDSQAASASSNPPSAKHPNFASLQQGTVFPNQGAPGAGVPPPVSGVPTSSGLEIRNTKSSANANVQLGPAQKALPQEPQVATNASPETATSVRQDTITSHPKSSGQGVAEPTEQKPAEASTQIAAASSGQTIAQGSSQRVAQVSSPNAASAPQDSSTQSVAQTPPAGPPPAANQNVAEVSGQNAPQALTQNVTKPAEQKPAEVPTQIMAASSGRTTSQETSQKVAQLTSPSTAQAPDQELAPGSSPVVAAIVPPATTDTGNRQAAEAMGQGGPQARPSIAATSDQQPPESSQQQVEKKLAPEVAAVSAPTPTESSSPKVGQESNNPNPSQSSGEQVAQESRPGAEGSGQGRAPMLPTRPGENVDFRTAFRVKYVAEDAAYLDGGRAAGLAEGMKLVVRDLPNVGAVAAAGADSNAAGDVAELEVLSVAETSAVSEIHIPKRPVKVGDLAYLSSADQQALVEKNALSATRKYPAVVSFTENDTLDEEARAEVPKPPLPSVNRARGRIGFDYIGVASHGGSGMYTNDLGMVLRADITRLNGTYWNVSGYWRGRMDHTSAGTQTLQDLINRTYHLYTSYDNPNSSWVAGFGRLYLPWATSLDTIDGGYFGFKLKTGVTTGLFMGSTPDPSSWSYAPNREIGGAFVNFQGGSYDDFHYSSTSGAGLNMLKWSPDRPFAFFENIISYKRVFSIYQASQVDNRPGYWYLDPVTNTNVWQPGTGWGAGRSFTTVRFQPHSRIEFSLNHTYFRDLPTFDPNLISTGMLDKYLFQGFSAGTRVEVHKQIWLSADLGLNNRSGDKKNSHNQMFGITFGRLPWIALHADARYTRFTSSYGTGSYEALSFSKNLGETLQLQILAGQQNFVSSLTSATHSRFLNGMVETALGPHYFVQAGGTISRGSQMNYDQWIFTFGYRFDNRHGHRGQ